MSVEDDDTWRGWRPWAVVVVMVTLLGLLNTSVVVTSWRAEGSDKPIRYAFLWEMTGAYTALALLPALVRFARRFPLRRGVLAARLPLHAAAFATFSVSATLLMWGSREALYRLLGWGHYDYGDMRWRFPMEAGKHLLGYLGAYLLITLLDSVRRSRERELRAARLEQELTEARLSALKMQLQPHFLFNALNMIASHVHDDPRTAEAMIGHLSDFLRLTLRRSDAQEVPLESELAFLEAYLAIMEARFEGRLAVEVDVPAEARGALVPHLILQPLVENSVTHCLERATRPGRIRVAASREGERLRLCVEDDGPGCAGGLGEALGRGVGLSNTASRLRHLYGPDQRLELVNLEQGGLRVDVELPFRFAGAGA